MAAFLTSPLIVGTTAKAEITHRATKFAPETSGNLRTFSDIPVGAASPKRYVIAVVAHGGLSGRLPDSIAIGGVSAPALYSQSNYITVYGALVPSGSTITALVTLAAGNSSGFVISVFTVDGYKSPIPTSLNGIQGANTLVPSTLAGVLDGAGSSAYLIVVAATSDGMATNIINTMDSFLPVGGSGPVLGRTAGMYSVVGEEGRANIQVGGRVTKISASNATSVVRAVIVGFT